MFSALLMQLIQSLFTQKEKKAQDDKEDGKDKKDDKEVMSKTKTFHNLKQQYEAALRVAYGFLSTFIRKRCGLGVGGSSDGDFRVLFEGLVSDLMVTLHKPNWPASQLLTQVL